MRKLLHHHQMVVIAFIICSMNDNSIITKGFFFNKKSDVVYGKSKNAQITNPSIAQKRIFFNLDQKNSNNYYNNNGQKKFHNRIPNELDSTVDNETPILPHTIPIQSGIDPLEYLINLKHNLHNNKNIRVNNYHRQPMVQQQQYFNTNPQQMANNNFNSNYNNRINNNVVYRNVMSQPQQSYHQPQIIQQQSPPQQQQQVIINHSQQQQPQQLQQVRLQQNQQQQINFEQQQTFQKLQLAKRQSPASITLCDEKYAQLVGDIFMGNEMVPEVLDSPPNHLLDLTYRTVRTYPGMRVTAEMTRFNPMLRWPAEEESLYTVILSNLDINSRKNRSLSEYWHWFVANVPEDNIDKGDVKFDLLHPLVLPDGDGDHRFGYFVLKQPKRLNYKKEGHHTDNCSPNMSKNRGPFRSTRDFIKEYDLELTAATFLIVDHSKASDEIACEWQKCMKRKTHCGDKSKKSPNRLVRSKDRWKFPRKSSSFWDF